MKISISIRIFVLFMIVIFASFIPELFPSFFGDFRCNGGIYEYNYTTFKTIRQGCQHANDSHNATTHFGYRHWVWIVMGATLFIIQIINIFDNDKK